MTFNLKDELEPGLHATTVTLTDGQARIEYQLYVYVSEVAVIDIDEDESLITEIDENNVVEEDTTEENQVDLDAENNEEDE